MAEGGGWITKYGVPGLIVSVAVFALQQQQQTFDRVQRSVESGYQFYASSRTQLELSGDVDREMSVLKIIGNAFPNIYCEVREDIYQRAATAGADTTGAPATGSPIDSTDLNTLRDGLNAADKPARPPYPENLAAAWSPISSNPACDPLDSTAQPAPADAVVASNDETLARAEPSAPAADMEESAAPPPPPPGAVTRGGYASAAPSSTASVAPAPALTSAPVLMRVFVHISTGSARNDEVAAPARAALAQYNYRVMRGVRRVDGRFGPEVRYFGDDEKAAADQLAAYLTWQFRNEGLRFTTRPIGAQYPNLPRQNLEVWIPG